MEIYRERLWPAPWMYIVAALVIPATLLIFVPISIEAGVIVALVLFTGSVVLLLTGAPLIVVTSEHLRAGAARLPLAHVGDVESLRKDDARAARGTGLDARAFIILRGYVDPVARIEVADDDDPAPYWLLSTREPEKLHAAIIRAKNPSPAS